MRTYNVRNLVVAGAFAALAVALTILYASTGRARAHNAAPMTTVIVAAHDVPVGVPAVQAFARHLLRARVVPAAAVVPDAVRNVADLRGLATTQPIFRGEQVTLRRFAPARAEGVLAELHGTMRAIQVAGDANQLLAGTLVAGERVDVLASEKSTEPNRAPVGRTVLRNLLVLRSPQKSSSNVGDDTYSVMLRTSDRQAQLLFYVTKNGDWSLTLRPVLRPRDSDTGAVTGIGGTS